VLFLCFEAKLELAIDVFTILLNKNFLLEAWELLLLILPIDLIETMEPRRLDAFPISFYSIGSILGAPLNDYILFYATGCFSSSI